MAQALTLRVPDEAAAEIRRVAQRERRSISEVGARIVEEWIRQNRYSQIEFRSINGERIACIKGGLEVWQAVMVARRYDNVGAAAEHLDLRPDQVVAALAYANDYPSEIDAAIAESCRRFDELKRILPSLERIEVPHDFKIS